MPRTLTQVLATAAFGAVLLAGCSGGSSSANPTDMPNVEPSSAPTTSSGSPTASHSPSSSMTPTTKTTKSATSSNGDAGAPGVPAAARKHTKAGAEAFVRYYFTELNRAWSLPKSGLLAPLALPTCKTCANYEATSADAAESGNHLDGPSATIESVRISSTASNELAVTVEETINRRRVLDSTGSVVDTVSRDKVRERFIVHWTSGGWRVKKIYDAQ